MARITRKVISLSVTPQEKARIDRLRSMNARSGRAQIMLLIDAELSRVDPDFLAKSLAAEAGEE